METELSSPSQQKRQCRKRILSQSSAVRFFFLKWTFTKLQINVKKSLTFSFVCFPATSVLPGTGTAPGSSKHHDVSSTWLGFAPVCGRSSFFSFSSSLKKGGACAGFTFSYKIKRMSLTQNWWVYKKHMLLWDSSLSLLSAGIQDTGNMLDFSSFPPMGHSGLWFWFLVL